MNSQTVCVSSSNNSSASSDSSNSSSTQSDSRLTVADILSSMANGESVPPSTFATLDGFSTGIPTRTTPTLTPTTLRNIEQTFIELQSVPPPTNHHHQAGFVPPVVNTTNASSHVTANTAYQNMSNKVESLWYSTPSPSPSPRSSSSGRGHTPKASGRMGGRRPNRDEKLSPEEEERRRVRRERNKVAAARCRKRRLDHTNLLLTETDGLEETKLGLQKEIGELQHQKEHLEFILDAHRCLCKGPNTSNNNNTNKINGISNHQLKEAIAVSTGSLPTSSSSPAIPVTSSSAYTDSKPLTRPTSLHLGSNFTVPTSTNLRLNTSVSVSEVAGIPISTPSNGMFNFDALMEGGTGLTPISSGLTPIIPTCSSQQRSSHCDLISPENINPPKLVSL